MLIRLLLVDPDIGFGRMIKLSLEENGQYRVSLAGSGEEAIRATAAGEFDLAIVETALPDMPGAQVMRSLRMALPRLPIVAILGDQEAADDYAELDLQGTLSKPIFLPDLTGVLQTALGLPVGGVMPVPRPEPAHGSTALRPSHAGPAAQASDVAPPTWLLDRDRAAQMLARLSLETAAAAALVLRSDRRWAYAGSLNAERVEELTRLVVEDRGRGASHAPVAKFARLGTQDLLVYTLEVTGDFALALAYLTPTPLGMIRKQARRLADALTLIDPATALYDPEPKESVSSSPRLAEAAVPLEPVEPPPQSTGPVGKWERVQLQPLQSKPEPLPMTDDQPQIQAPMPEPNEFAPDLEAPAQPLAGLEHVPGALYRLAYTFVILPKFPQYRLVGDLAIKMHELIRTAAIAFHWRVERLSVHPSHAVIVLSCPPASAPERVVRALRRATSQRLALEFPRLLADDPSGDFWARSYLLLGSGQDPTPGQVADFIASVRRQQGLT